MDQLGICHANQTSMCLIDIRIKGEVSTLSNESSLSPSVIPRFQGPFVDLFIVCLSLPYILSMSCNLAVTC